MSTWSTWTKLGGCGGRYKHPPGVGVSVDADRTNLWRPVGHMDTTRRDDPPRKRLIPGSRPRCAAGAETRKRDVACRACRIWACRSVCLRASRPEAACHRPRRHPGGGLGRPLGRLLAQDDGVRGADVDGVGGLELARRELLDQRCQRRRLGGRLARRRPTGRRCRRPGSARCRRGCSPPHPPRRRRTSAGSALTAASAARVVASPGPRVGHLEGHHARRGFAGDQVEEDALGIDQGALPRRADDRHAAPARRR